MSPKIIDKDEVKNDVARETSVQSNGYKPVIFFSQSAGLIIGDDLEEERQEKRDTGGMIRQPSAVIQFTEHFYTAKTKREYDVIMRAYPPVNVGDGNTRPNKQVMPVSEDFVAKFNTKEYEKIQAVRRRPEERTPDIDEEEIIKKFDE